MTLQPGARLGPYEITAPLGAGGMGEVYKAKDTRLDRLVAVKVLPEHLARDPEALARFEREAKAVAALNHPNILALHDIGRTDDTAYAVMELLEGETLRARLMHGALPAREAVDLVVQMALGLAAAHEKGIVHRDLKPENLWITKDGRLKILDFGLAKQMSGDGLDPEASTRAISPGHHTEKGTILGTVGYMSPEQVRGETLNARSDIFSFGVVLFEMFTGRKAFVRDSAAETLAAILKEDPPEVEDSGKPIPPGLRRILDHCLEKVPARRFQDAHDLAFALQNEHVSSSERIRLAASPASAHRLKRLAAWIAVVAVAGTAGLMVGRLGRAPATPTPTFTALTLDGETIRAARFMRRGQSVVFSTQSNDLVERNIRQVDLGSPLVRTLLGPDAWLLSVGPGDELAVLTGMKQALRSDTPIGTLGRCPPGGALPQPLAKDIIDAEWRLDGTLAVVRRTGNWYGYQLEYPEGRVLLAEPKGYLKDPRFSPDGRHLAVLRHPEGSDDLGPVTLVDLKSGKVRDLTPAWGSIEGLAWRPDGREVWFTANDHGVQWDLYGADLEGRVRRIFAAPGGLYLHDISPDGRVLLSSYDQKLRVWADRADRPAPVELNIGSSCFNLDLSADGRWAILEDQTTAKGPAYPLFLRPTDGSLPTPLGMGYAAKFAPDGQRICIWRFVDAHWVPSIVSIAGGEEVWPVGDLDVSGRPVFTWTAGGDLLVYSRSSAGPPRLWRLTKQGPVSLDVPVPEDLQEFAVPDTAGRSLLLRRRGLGWFVKDLRHLEAPLEPCPGLQPSDWLRGFSSDGGWMYVSADRSSAFSRVDLRTGRREPLPAPRAVGYPASYQTSLSRDGQVFVGVESSIYSRLYLAEGLE